VHRRSSADWWVDTAGRFADRSEAVAFLANQAAPFFQVLAVIANAGVEEPEDLLAYAPPIHPDDTGEFVVQRHSQMRSPAARLRKVAAAEVLAVLELLNRHPRAERLQRGMWPDPIIGPLAMRAGGWLVPSG
jgi:hypothetical protein